MNKTENILFKTVGHVCIRLYRKVFVMKPIDAVLIISVDFLFRRTIQIHKKIFHTTLAIKITAK